jgi:hypothetical protein
MSGIKRVCDQQSSIHQVLQTDVEITKAVNPLKQNADVSIRTNFEINSNVMDESDSQHEQQPWSSLPTDDGRTRSVNPLSQNANASIRTFPTQIQM